MTIVSRSSIRFESSTNGSDCEVEIQFRGSVADAVIGGEAPNGPEKCTDQSGEQHGGHAAVKCDFIPAPHSLGVEGDHFAVAPESRSEKDILIDSVN